MRHIARALGVALAVLVLWQLARLAWLAGDMLIRQRAHRIGNWFRLADQHHYEAYRNEERYRIERARAEEEGWRVINERRDRPTGWWAVLYERVEPPLGHDNP